MSMEIRFEDRAMTDTPRTSNNRDAFEKWLLDAHGFEPKWVEDWNRYEADNAQLAFKAWQAASERGFARGSGNEGEYQRVIKLQKEQVETLQREVARLIEANEAWHRRVLLGATSEPGAIYSDSRIRELIRSLNPHSETFVGGTIDDFVVHVRKWLGVIPRPAQPPLPDEPPARYQCMVKGCPANHASKRDVCDTRQHEAIAVWLDAEGEFQWDFEINEDHPIDAVIVLARRTNWVMTGEGWRLGPTKFVCRAGGSVCIKSSFDCHAAGKCTAMGKGAGDV